MNYAAEKCTRNMHNSNNIELVYKLKNRITTFVQVIPLMK